MDYLWIVLGVIVYFIYNVRIFNYASKILIEPDNNILRHLILSAINTVVIGVFYSVNIPQSFFYIFATLILGIEFMLIAKADILQSFTGAAIFLAHISIMHTLSTVIFSKILGEPPSYVMDNLTLRYMDITITCLLLITINFIVDKTIDAVSIQRITTAKKYTKLLFITAMFIVIFESFHSALIMNDENYDAQLWITIAVSLSLGFIFYRVFLYNMLLINATLYKRYSDSAIEEQKRILDAKKNIARKIERDSLTGIYSRRYILTTLEELCMVDDSRFSVLFVDVNGLKVTNDKYGHDTGDKLIVSISEAIGESIRDDDFVARIGGDEFVVVLYNTEKEDIEVIIQRIHQNISIKNEHVDFDISASIGYLIVDEDTKKLGVEHILAKADEHMRINKSKFYSNKGDS